VLDFSNILDLPLIWGGLITIAIFLYVLLDGFDLGVGILFPFAPSNKCRSRMMNSIAPFWDGNETWLILGGGGLFAAFPLAYAILMPAFYIPIILMLIGLIFRGVAFEFRFKASKKRVVVWDRVFHFGSLLAAFMQGAILGAFAQGVKVSGRAFAGDPFDWLTGFSLLTGVALVAGYALLGATWLIMKTEDQTQKWARQVARYVMVYVGIFMLIVSGSMPFVHADVRDFWFSLPNFYYLLPIPLITAVLFIVLWKKITTGGEALPFFLSISLFALGYIGLGLSIWPWIVPYQVNLWEAAAVAPSQSLLLVGVVLFLPIVLTYTGYCYYVFRGKASHEAMY
jgi:cytochrome d ubiquinol oxidase subunit II